MNCGLLRKSSRLFDRDVSGIIVCSKWQSGPGRGNPSVYDVIGNSSLGDGELS
ncbi:MAG: hypothetical protein SPI46_06935 [Eubacteriales bacterium]|nr:hypothetical protein [Christensenellaceae bacterium]MDY6079096.1 hypothetical protein [Eubacteriales bacterium]